MRGLSPEARERLAEAIRKAGGQAAIARRLGISRQNLNNVLRTGQGIGASRLAAIAAEAGVTVDYVLTGGQLSNDRSAGIVQIPIVEIEVAAGAGRSAAAMPAMIDSLSFPESYARSLGSVQALRIVTARGDSQSPDIEDGDLIMYEEGTPYRAEGMYVVVLDGDMMVKRLQRAGGGMRLLSRNPAYAPIDVSAEQLQDRLRVLGKVVWSGRKW